MQQHQNAHDEHLLFSGDPHTHTARQRDGVDGDAEAVTPSSEHTEVMRPFMKSRSEMAS